MRRYWARTLHGTIDDVRAALGRSSLNPDPDVRCEEDSARGFLLVRLGNLPDDTRHVTVLARGGAVGDDPYTLQVHIVARKEAPPRE